MMEVNFESLLDAAIEALDGWDDFVEEAVEVFVAEVEDYDWVSARP